MSDSDAEKAGRLVGFATLGILTTTQELAAAALAGMPDADPEEVAEETLALLSVISARSIAFGLTEQPAALQAAIAAVEEAPLLYSDYLLGEAVLTGSADVPTEAIYERIRRRQSFYGAHFVPGQFPTLRMLDEKMELWMGRISSPGLSSSPRERLEALALVNQVSTHARLLSSYARQL